MEKKHIGKHFFAFVFDFRAVTGPNYDCDFHLTRPPRLSYLLYFMLVPKYYSNHLQFQRFRECHFDFLYHFLYHFLSLSLPHSPLQLVYRMATNPIYVFEIISKCPNKYREIVSDGDWRWHTIESRIRIMFNSMYDRVVKIAPLFFSLVFCSLCCESGHIIKFSDIVSTGIGSKLIQIDFDLESFSQ